MQSKTTKENNSKPNKINIMEIKPKSTREHLISLYGHITGLKRSQYHMHKGIHELGGKIDKIYWVLLGTVGAVSLVLLERLLDIKGIIF